jgi:hypothetical protein
VGTQLATDQHPMSAAEEMKRWQHISSGGCYRE